jgi:hypothetical protein
VMVTYVASGKWRVSPKQVAEKDAAAASIANPDPGLPKGR